jgi:O-antigen ligase
LLKSLRAVAERLLPDRSLLVRGACLLYVGHLAFQGKIAVSEIAAGFAVVLVYIAVRKGELRLTWNILYFPLFLYGLASTLSSIVAPERQHMFGEQMLWLKMLIFPVALILMRQVPRMKDYALYGHAIFLSWISLDGLLEYVREPHDLEHRITGGATHVMTYSGELLPLALLFLILFVHERKVWMLAPALLSTFALLLTFTRSAWLGWLVALFVVIVSSRPRLLAWAAPLLVIFLIVAPVNVFGRLMSSFSTQQESNLDRIRMLQAGGEIIRDYPLFGVGPANVKPLYPLYRLPDSPRFRTPHLHNNIVQIWAERGIVALTAYLLLIILFIRECAAAWRTPGRGWAEAGLAAVVALTFAGLFEFNFGDTEVFYLLLDVMALVIVNLDRVNRQPAALVPPFA